MRNVTRTRWAGLLMATIFGVACGATDTAPTAEETSTPAAEATHAQPCEITWLGPKGSEPGGWTHDPDVDTVFVARHPVLRERLQVDAWVQRRARRPDAELVDYPLKLSSAGPDTWRATWTMNVEADYQLCIACSTETATVDVQCGEPWRYDARPEPLRGFRALP